MVSFFEDCTFHVHFESLTVIERPSEAPVYNGEYEVVPKVGVKTVLQTRDKLLKDDVTVAEIPIHRTSNVTGTTVYIGKKVV